MNPQITSFRRANGGLTRCVRHASADMASSLMAVVRDGDRASSPASDLVDRFRLAVSVLALGPVAQQLLSHHQQLIVLKWLL